VRVVQVWFQNQRAKMKKLARKQSGEKTGEENKKNAANKKEKKKQNDEADEGVCYTVQGIETLNMRNSRFLHFQKSSIKEMKLNANLPVSTTNTYKLQLYSIVLQ
jgi:hypothetical protein